MYRGGCVLRIGGRDPGELVGVWLAMTRIINWIPGVVQQRVAGPRLDGLEDAHLEICTGVFPILGSPSPNRLTPPLPLIEEIATWLSRRQPRLAFIGRSLEVLR